jgi:hypothetical protein
VEEEEEEEEEEDYACREMGKLNKTRLQSNFRGRGHRWAAKQMIGRGKWGETNAIPHAIKGASTSAIFHFDHLCR